MTARAETIIKETDAFAAAEKETVLRDSIRRMKNVVIAFSGGIDSAYLAFIANRTLGRNAVCVLGLSPSVSEFQRKEAFKIADDLGLNFETIDTNELADPNYAANPQNRCFFCKSELFGRLRGIAAGKGIEHLLDGTNADDIGGHRPGYVAAANNGVRSPLVETGFTKNEIRVMSKLHGLSGWANPASPCLSSRIAYGVPVTAERLSKVERGEEFLRSLGFVEFRVRVHDELARIEIASNEMERAMRPDLFRDTAEAFKRIGFKYVTLDLNGYRSGAMNEINILDK